MVDIMHVAELLLLLLLLTHPLSISRVAVSTCHLPCTLHV